MSKKRKKQQKRTRSGLFESSIIRIHDLEVDIYRSGINGHIIIWIGFAEGRENIEVVLSKDFHGGNETFINVDKLLTGRSEHRKKTGEYPTVKGIG